MVFSQSFADKGSRGTSQQRKEYINSLTPQQRRDLIRQYRENYMMQDLHVSGSDREKFSNIYNRYQQDQRKIKEEFNPNFDPQKLSDDEARQKLEQSFITGQKLLENRRKYANEMQTILSPQQILQMFRNEGRMRDKFRENLEKRPDMNNQNPDFRRNNSGFRGPAR